MTAAFTRRHVLAGAASVATVAVMPAAAIAQRITPRPARTFVATPRVREILATTRFNTGAMDAERLLLWREMNRETWVAADQRGKVLCIDLMFAGDGHTLEPTAEYLGWTNA
jgi:hypothetical protein